MSGGFFRGTSADQDTRFSNKQAKLLKSQKFPPELDHPVDMSKVKMDVIKPWIAHRVTELLGFEDEVLINFIYGLLEEKKGGKEVQIQITGFMEKNTGKFMKELWGLLLSAQNNASGVPQQFLDAKEEEIRIKKVETDRITHEIQKKKELEQEKRKKMDEEVDISKAVDDASNRVPKHSSAQREDDKGSGERNGLRGKNRSSRSPRSAEHSPSADRMNRSRSISKSFSNSRSYSESLSRSPQSQRRSISPDRRYRSPRKRSLSPRLKYSPRRPRSPLRRRSPHSRRRSSSYSRRRSPSPRRRRSPSPVIRRSPPRRRRSPTPVRRRSPTPIRRGSPSIVRRRSPTPVRRRSPPTMRRRSPSPVRRRSPIGIRRRSPSPSRYRSPSPRHRRSPSPLRRRSPPRSPRQRRRSPLRSPRQKYRSGSPFRSRSPAYRRRRSLSRDHDVQSNGVVSRKHRDDYVAERPRGRKYPSQSPERGGVEHSGQGHKGLDPVTHQPPITLRSPQRDPRDRTDAGRKRPALLPSPGISPSQSSSLQTGKSSPSEDLRTSSLSEGPTRNTRERVIRADSASPVRQTRHLGALNDTVATVRERATHYSRVDKGQRTESPPKRIRHSPRAGGHRNIPTKDPHHEDYSPERLADRKLAEAEHRLDDIEIRRKDRDKKSEKGSLRIDRPLSPTKNSTHMMDVEDGPGRVEVKRFSPDKARDEHPSAKQRNSPSPKRLNKPYSREDYKVDEKKHSHSHNIMDSGLGEEIESSRKSTKRVHSISTNRTATLDSDSENEKNKSKDMESRKLKRQDRHHMASDDDTSYDSHVDERKEAKRRKKEEKKLRKEEKRRRREERHRRREERRAGKLKAKTVDTVTPPSDVEKNRSDADDSDDHIAAKIDSHPSDIEETESEQKKLEIELRKKALESLRAKKAINP